MAVVSKCFFRHEKGNHDETWFYLARDTETGEVFVIHEWAARANVGSERVALTAFLARNESTAKSNLLRLIGSLANEPHDA
ncbi:MAG: hypothetical protein K2X74_00800 [Acetobacteraceae bacterium]|nr:hypothetical protein [Acetobacteraceae bacterium]